MKLSTLILAISPLLAQQVEIQGITSGFVYEEASRSIRPILGTAGAARLGDAIYADADFASIAPNGRAALVTRSGRLILLRDLTKADPGAEFLDAAIATLRQVLWAEDSSSAVLVSAVTTRVQRISNLAGSPAFDDVIDLAAQGSITFAASDREARKLAIGVRGDVETALYFVADSGQASLLSVVADASAAAFTVDGQDLYVADRTTKQVLLFRNAGPGSAASTVLDSSSGIGDPVGLAADRERLLVLDAQARTVWAFQLPSVTFMAAYSVEGEIQRIERVGGSSSYYRLTFPKNSGETLWLLDAQREPSVFFVPAK